MPQAMNTIMQALRMQKLRWMRTPHTTRPPQAPT
jgi:hypothetical protein